jgi:hypothetical protein
MSATTYGVRAFRPPRKPRLKRRGGLKARTPKVFSITLGAALLLVVFAPIAGAQSPIKPGDRIAIVGNTFADQLRMHGYFETLLLQRSQGTPVSIRNLGWAGDMLTVRDRPTAFPSEEKTLTAHKTDVIIGCWGMGESFAGQAGLAQFRKDLDAFVASHRGKSYNGKSEVRLIFVSPIAYENLGEITPGQEKRNKELAAYTQTMAVVAAEKKIPFVNLNEPIAELMRAGDGPKLTSNGITLRAYGYWAAGRILADGVLGGNSAWQLTVDAKAKSGTGRGVAVSGVKTDGDGVQFSVKEEVWPALGPPGGKAHAALAGERDTLVVTGLAPGRYALLVDGEPVTTASHSDWATGVAIDGTPAHTAAEVYREAVNEKNRQFTYGWKALNTVHIFGERKKSPSGKNLPGEIIEFDKLANEQDAALSTGVELKTRTWRIIPAK